MVKEGTDAQVLLNQSQCSYGPIVMDPNNINSLSHHHTIPLLAGKQPEHTMNPSLRSPLFDFTNPQSGASLP